MFNNKIKGSLLSVFCVIWLCGCDLVPNKETLQQHAARPIVALKEEQGITNIFSATTPPQHVTLLLPLTGKLAESSQAIRNGFLTAHYYAKKHSQVSTEIEFLDTNQANVLDLYQRALDAKSDFIIGPLAKPDVAVLMSAPSLQIPVLALNTIDTYQNNSPKKIYQFGLSPQDEATQIASKIIKDGHSKVLVVAPASPWSTVLVNAFKVALTNQRGNVVDQLNYNKQTDFSSSISRLLHAEQSVRSKNSGSQINTAELSSYRRQDFDAIFIIAKPEDARQIYPLLKFYYAGNIQTYATSLVYSGMPNPQLDFDLDGIVFCDLPWILQNSNDLPNYLQDTKKQIVGTWPNENPDINKLYALGVDSYNIMRFLNATNFFPKQGLQGATGNLFLTSSNHIYRSLIWAKMQNGQPIIIDN